MQLVPSFFSAPLAILDFRQNAKMARLKQNKMPKNIFEIKLMKEGN